MKAYWGKRNESGWLALALPVVIMMRVGQATSALSTGSLEEGTRSDQRQLTPAVQVPGHLYRQDKWALPSSAVTEPQVFFRFPKFVVFYQSKT